MGSYIKKKASGSDKCSEKMLSVLGYVRERDQL
jgi:hypothetical protein